MKARWTGMAIQRAGKRRLVLVIPILVILTISLTSIVSRENCGEVLGHANQLASTLTQEDRLKAHKYLEGKSATCEKPPLFQSSESPSWKAKQVEYYHLKAKLSFVLARYPEAQKNAKKGLDVYSKLSDKERKLVSDNEEIVAELKFTSVDPYAENR